MEYEIVDNIWERLVSYTTLDNNFILITDENIYNIYKLQIGKLLKGRKNIYVIKPGEESKSLDKLKNIYEKLIHEGIDRQGLILGLGGGVVGDISGFAAATYKRGINHIQIPTTLLAQVDSSIGGKTALDFQGHKNIIGSFHSPLKSYIDISFLSSLPDKEIVCGLGEVIKYGIIQDYELLKYTGNNIKSIYLKDREKLLYIVEKSLKIKSEIVKKDLLDLGIRQKLNFGHTIGHSIESLFQYKKYNHGEAVIQGIIYESNIAYEKKLIDKEYYNEIISLSKSLVNMQKYRMDEINIMLKYMKGDKKNKDGKITFVLPIGKGKTDIFYDVEESYIKKSLLNDY